MTLYVPARAVFTIVPRSEGYARGKQRALCVWSLAAFAGGPDAAPSLPHWLYLIAHLV